jgi:hypothetical protein
MRRVALVLACLCGGCTTNRVADASLWFDAVSFTSPSTVVGAITPADLAVIQEEAVREAARAFDGFRVSVARRPDARYHVRVVQRLRDPRQRRFGTHAGESRAITGFGGAGAVSFEYFASIAIGYAPAGAERTTIVEAIGRCIGRGAVHEFAHQLLPRAPIHDSLDRRSYEFGSAGREEHCYGPIGWGPARPLLQARFGIAP